MRVEQPRLSGTAIRTWTLHGSRSYQVHGELGLDKIDGQHLRLFLTWSGARGKICWLAGPLTNAWDKQWSAQLRSCKSEECGIHDTAGGATSRFLTPFPRSVIPRVNVTGLVIAVVSRDVLVPGLY